MEKTVKHDANQTFLQTIASAFGYDIVKKEATDLSKEEGKEAVKLEQAKLADGETVVEFDNLAAGENLYVMADGERIPAPEGEHELEDGRVVVVAEEGIIAEIREKTSEEAGDAEKEEEIDMGDMKKRMEELEAKVASLMKGNQDLSEEKSELEKANANLETELAKVKTELSEVKAEPAAEPTNPNPEEKTKGEFDHNVYLSLRTTQEKIAYKMKHGKF